MIKKMIFSVLIIISLSFILSGCSETDNISSKEEELISKSLKDNLNYNGSYTVIDINNQSYGLGSNVNRTIKVNLDDINVEIKMLYNLNTFSKVTKETYPLPYLNEYVENYLVNKDLDLSSDDFGIAIMPEYSLNVESNKLSYKEELSILKGEKDNNYSIYDYLNRYEYYSSIDFTLDTESDVLNSESLRDFLNYIRKDINTKNYDIYIEDNTKILNISLESDDLNLTLDDIAYLKGNFDKSNMQDIDYILNNNFDDYEILDILKPYDSQLSDIVFYTVRDNITNEDFNVWITENLKTNDDGEVISYSSTTSGLDLYTNRLSEVVNEKIGTIDLGNLSLYGEGSNLKRILGFTKDEIELDFDRISNSLMYRLSYAITLNQSIDETNRSELAEYIHLLLKLFPNNSGGDIVLVYSDNSELLNEFRKHPYKSLSEKDTIWRISSSKSFDTSSVKDVKNKYKDVFELNLTTDMFKDDNNVLNVSEIEDKINEKIISYKERQEYLNTKNKE